MIDIAYSQSTQIYCRWVFIHFPLLPLKQFFLQYREDYTNDYMQTRNTRKETSTKLHDTIDRYFLISHSVKGELNYNISISANPYTSASRNGGVSAARIPIMNFSYYHLTQSTLPHAATGSQGQHATSFSLHKQPAIQFCSLNFATGLLQPFILLEQFVQTT